MLVIQMDLSGIMWYETIWYRWPQRVTILPSLPLLPTISCYLLQEIRIWLSNQDRHKAKHPSSRVVGSKSKLSHLVLAQGNLSCGERLWKTTLDWLLHTSLHPCRFGTSSKNWADLSAMCSWVSGHSPIPRGTLDFSQPEKHQGFHLAPHGSELQTCPIGKSC